MDLSGKRVAILAEDLYQEMELWYPLYRLREAGAEVVVVGPTAGETYKSKAGYPVTADRAAAEVAAEDFDAVIIPGGYAPDRMRRNAALVRFVREMHASGKVVAAICHAGWVAISAGILRGRRATSVAAIKDDMTNAGALWVDEPVVVDGTLVTSRTPDDLPHFCREIVRALGATVGAR